MRWIALISSGHSIHMQKSTPSAQGYIEHSPGRLRLDINYKKKKKKYKKHKHSEMNNTFLNNQKFTEEIKREIKKFLETNDNENTAQNLWDAAKAVLIGKFIPRYLILFVAMVNGIDSLISLSDFSLLVYRSGVISVYWFCILQFC